MSNGGIIRPRNLNHFTDKNGFPIPIVKDLIDELYGSIVFAKFNLRSGYQYIRMKGDENGKTAFRTHARLYEFVFNVRVCPPLAGGKSGVVVYEHSLWRSSDISIFGPSYARTPKEGRMVIRTATQVELIALNLGLRRNAAALIEICSGVVPHRGQAACR
ncbi:hypothetical protein Tco_0608045 [Tanacetum coccineum]